ncbi:MAG: hypothetical protein HON90_14545 [Halobacteriovoraceae bacterium]|nr:hypothetical protein [Halobacteriovoraceae bacterium]
MKSDVVSKFTEIWLPSTALILFLTVFFVMLIFVWKKSASGFYADAERLPFDEGKRK